MANSDIEEVPVLIVGGSIVGLSAALFLAAHSVRCMGVERHGGTAIHPRAGHFHLRTLELMRSVGLEELVRRTSEEQYPPDGGINAVESLAGHEIGYYISNLNAGVDAFSPTVRLFMSQERLEPVLRARAEELGADLHYGSEVTSLEEDDDGVTATIVNLADGAQRRVRAQYVIAADGNRSPIRERLGIEMKGHGLLSNSLTIYFRANCAPYLEGRNNGVIYVFNDVLRGFFRLEKAGDGGFLAINTLADTSSPAATQVSEGITEERCIEFVRAAIGVPDIPVEILDMAPWRAVAESATRYRQGRIFLAGDAAHTMPPNGGFGGNTGVQDAHNLAWKLAMVLDGSADPALLDTYDAERRPIGADTVEQAYTRYVGRTAPYLGIETCDPVVDELSMEIGYRYHSAGVISEDGDDGMLHEHPSTSAGRPGSRAPHIFLKKDEEPVSTLDLFGRRFVLLAGPDGEDWCVAARSVADDLGFALDTHLLGSFGKGVVDPYGRFPKAYDVSWSGAVIVRPDGFVGWRSAAATEKPEAVLRDVFAALLGRRQASEVSVA
jgi:2-polyprenyl-6-methoxyphenol hydroxylase-like FAD-dependent oxidoreductase